MDKIGYLFDPVTKVFTGVVGIQESPLEKGFYLMPPHCTVSEPLPEVAGKDTVYFNGNWAYTTKQVLPQEPVTPVTDIRQTMQVSRFQGKAALLQAGFLDQVEAYFTANGSPIEKLAWQDVLVFERLSPLVISMGQLLNLSETQLDQLFIQASGIKV